ncbi:MAG: cyclophilin-like fold protein [Nitrososphaeria archaeon]|nr:cyclophilin-like fold protein [Nitrososphaeria archaeon]MDW8021197.1 cyclophilin-like fold protein [Nitrososphaerota archaeon]
MPYRVDLEFDGGVKAACLLDEIPELEKLVGKSPFKGKANRWGDEIYFELPVKLQLRGERTLMEVGEVAYWPEGNSLCLFFGPTPVSRGDKPVAYSDVKPLGRVIEGLENLKKVKDGEGITVKMRKV